MRAIFGFAAALAALCLGWWVHGALRLAPTGAAEPTGASAQLPRDGAEYPRAVDLPWGGRLLQPRRPTRIVATTSRALEFLVELCPKERIVGYPEQALEYSTIDAAEAAALGHATVFYTYAAEPILRLAPDLVVADLWQAQETHGHLAAAGVPLLVLPEIVDWPDVRAALLALGRVVGEEQRAEYLVAEGEARIARLEARAALVPNPRVLVYSNFGAQGFSAGSNTSIDAILRLAGARNALAERGAKGHVPIGFEELLRIDPDWFLVGAPLQIAPSHTGDRGGASEAILLGEPALASLTAVRERRIAVLSAGLFASNSRAMIRAAEQLAERIHGPLTEEESR